MSRKSEVFNEDCMIGMRRYPDKYFDLAVVDPPYGGGGQGFAGPERFGGRFDRYRASTAIGPVSRTGGKWAAKYGKKLSPGTTRQAENTLMNCFAFPSNRSFGEETTFRFRRAGAF